MFPAIVSNLQSTREFLHLLFHIGYEYFILTECISYYSHCEWGLLFPKEFHNIYLHDVKEFVLDTV